ncbi:MAG TPA: hypothetical protein VNT52_13145, partial [Acidimicrobiales bacterium]|nr:hypothetical protein [Acidimicrobiales bacterium]
MPSTRGRSSDAAPTIRRRTAGSSRDVVLPEGQQGTVAPAAGAGIEDWRDNPLDPMAPIGVRSRAVEPDTSRIRLGPLEKIYLIWMVGGSCDGCTVSVTGAVHPRVEHLLAGIVPGLPRVELIHTVVSTEVGPEWTHNLFMAERGELDAPYVITWEGSIMDESIAGDGYWMGLGE